jgi:tetratricopeptide (TPR) repeat protein/pimeloyl-ACP methyl ester carboxylesterase
MTGRCLRTWLVALASLATLLALPARAADIDRWSDCMARSGPSAAIKACSAIIESGKELPDSLPYAYVYRAKAHLALKEGDLAFKDFTAALKFEPPLAHAHYGLGLIAKAREDWPHAIDEFSKTIDSQAEDADIDDFTADSEGSLRAAALTERGYAIFKNGDATKAIVDFDAATKLCPTCSAPWRDRALALDVEQKGADAMAAANQAIALDTRSSLAFLVRGFLKGRAGEYDEAIADYSEAIRLSPSFELPYKARAGAYAKLGKRMEAAADDKTVALLAQGSADALATAAPPDADAAKAIAAPALDDAALLKLFSAKTWEARQGPWAVTLEFRGDGTFRQRAKDTSPVSTLEVASDGAWGISRGELCINTNIGLCLTGHQVGGNIALTRAEIIGGRAAAGMAEGGALEYFGASDKLIDLKADAVSDPVTEFPVDEVFMPGPPGVARGPKTLFYYLHGFDGRARAHPPLPEFFIGEIQSSRGWDMIDGAYPRSGVSAIRRFGGSNWGAAEFVARRLRELKAQGYQRIYVGGQSWGGWNSLDLATMPGLPLDGVVLVVPACCGWRPTGASTDDPNFANNKFYFDQLIQHVRYPTVGVFFLGDEYEPADRGKGAAEALAKRGVANLMIDHPPGFSGHGSAWFPLFDYEYRPCVVAFLVKPVATQCRGRTIAERGGDFRAILTAKQVVDWPKRTATLSEVTGRRFAVYPDGDERTIASPDKTEVKGYGMGESVFASSFRGDLYCVRERVKYAQPQTTDETCVNLVKWSDGELLALDKQSGNVVQWWVERK